MLGSWRYNRVLRLERWATLITGLSKAHAASSISCSISLSRLSASALTSRIGHTSTPLLLTSRRLVFRQHEFSTLRRAYEQTLPPQTSSDWDAFGSIDLAAFSVFLVTDQPKQSLTSRRQLCL